MALLYNLNRGKGQPSRTEDEFIPKRAKKEDRPESKEALASQIHDVFSAFM